MGQIKNIKLHIVTDIKDLTTWIGYLVNRSLRILNKCLKMPRKLDLEVGVEINLIMVVVVVVVGRRRVVLVHQKHGQTSTPLDWKEQRKLRGNWISPRALSKHMRSPVCRSTPSSLNTRRK